MNSPRQRETIVDAIRAIVFDGFYVGRFHFGATTAVDEPQAGDGTSAIIGVQYNPAKHAVAYDTGTKIADPLPRLIKYKLGRMLGHLAWFQLRESGQWGPFLNEPSIKDAVKILN